MWNGLGGEYLTTVNVRLCSLCVSVKPEVISALTALFRVPVVADQDFLCRDAEEAGPVDGVVVAQLAVVGDVDVAGTDLTQRLQLQR